MNPSEPGTQSAQTLSPSQQDQMLALARRLLQAVRTGMPWRPLRGRNLGLLCEDDASDGAELFRAACHELGARTATLQPSLSWFNAPQEVAQIARVLGRLYDAIECQGLSPALVEQLRAHAGVPVLEAAALPAPTKDAIAAQIEAELPLTEGRRYLLEANLLDALGLGR